MPTGDDAPSAGPSEAALDVDRLVEELRAKVEQRRSDGSLSPELELSLDDHFEQLMGGMPANATTMPDDIDSAVQALRTEHFGRDRIETSSRVVGGASAHRVIGKAIGRQVQGVLQQSQQHAQLVAHTMGLVAELATSIGRELDGPVFEQLDDLQLRLAEQQRSLAALDQSLFELAARVPGVPVDTWYSEDRFTAIFRGGADDMRERYRGLAEELVGLDPVLEIGFGRGEFLALLDELGVKARGIEPSAQLVHDGREQGLDVEVGTAVEYLAGVRAASLGGLVMIQVIEHLSPQHVIDFVRLAYEKVRPGGKVIVETVNPKSLYVYAHAFWVDPDHTRPVHPDYLEFLFGEAGFTDLRREYRSPVPTDEALELLPGDDEVTKLLNANFERINDLLFGPQDYAFIATR